MTVQEIRSQILVFLLPMKAIASMTQTAIDDIVVAVVEAIVTNDKLAADIDTIIKQVATMRGVQVT